MPGARVIVVIFSLDFVRFSLFWQKYFVIVKRLISERQRRITGNTDQWMAKKEKFLTILESRKTKKEKNGKRHWETNNIFRHFVPPHWCDYKERKRNQKLFHAVHPSHLEHFWNTKTVRVCRDPRFPFLIHHIAVSTIEPERLRS